MNITTNASHMLRLHTYMIICLDHRDVDVETDYVHPFSFSPTLATKREFIWDMSMLNPQPSSLNAGATGKSHYGAGVSVVQGVVGVFVSQFPLVSASVSNKPERSSWLVLSLCASTESSTTVASPLRGYRADAESRIMRCSTTER